MAAERDWAALPPDLIHLVSKKLPDISDVIRFRAVCTPWRTSVVLSDPSLRLPWLFLSDESRSRSSSNLRFYSLSSGKTYTINVPEMCGKKIFGSLQQYLLVSNCKKGCSISLINPLTRKEIPLPPLPPDERCCIPSQVQPDLFPHGEFDYIVVFGIRPNTVSFCRIGDQKWSSLELKEDELRGYHCPNGIYFCHNGIYYADSNSIDDAIAKDMRTGVVLYKIPSPPFPGSGLARKTSVLMKIDGELIKVFELCKFSADDFESEDLIIEAYRLDHGNGKPSWVKYEIKDLMLFLNWSTGFAMSSAEFKEKCVYYIKDQFFNYRKGYIRLGKHDLEANRTEDVACLAAHSSFWIAPNLL